MKIFLYICIVLSFLNLFLIIYTWTLPLYPQKLRDKWNQDSLVGVANLFMNLVTGLAWCIYFYFYLFTPQWFYYLETFQAEINI